MSFGEFFGMFVKTAIYVSSGTFREEIFSGKHYIFTFTFDEFQRKLVKYHKISAGLSKLHSKCPELNPFVRFSQKMQKFGGIITADL